VQSIGGRLGSGQALLTGHYVQYESPAREYEAFGVESGHLCGVPRFVAHSKPAGHWKQSDEPAGEYSEYLHGTGLRDGSAQGLPIGH